MDKLINSTSKEKALEKILIKCDSDFSDYDEKSKTLNISELHIKSLTIEELNVLNELEIIKGDLIIESCFINNLCMFNNLKKVNRIIIRKVDSLEFITGFNQLESLKSLTIEGNKKLKEIFGFNDFFLDNKEISGAIKIINNPLLENISFLKGLTKVNSSFYIHHNSLNTLEGLENLEHVNASFSLSSNKLTSLKSLSKLKYVKGMLGLVNNNLETLCGLENLEELKSVKWGKELRTLALNSNPLLHDISALENVKSLDSVITLKADTFSQYKKLPSETSKFYENLIEVHEKNSTDIIELGNKLVEKGDYLEHLEDENRYFALSNQNNIGGTIVVNECKFIIVDVQSNNPKFYWMNTKKHVYHYMFYKNILNRQCTMSSFDSISYSNDKRDNIVGTLVYHEKPVEINNSEYQFAVNFWPSDSIEFEYIQMAMKMLEENAPFLKDRLFFHIVSQIQQENIDKNKELFLKNRIESIDSETLMSHIDFLPMNNGVSYGVLRFSKDTANFSVKDIVVLHELPNHLSHVSGIITELPQTPLSHINLLAKQNKIPNAYLKEASLKNELLELKDKYVKFEITNTSYKVSKATSSEVESYFNKIRPNKELSPLSNLSQKNILSFDDLNNSDYDSFGTKSSNLGEMNNIFEKENLPHGFGIPFYFYDEFMKHNDFYNEIERLNVKYNKSDDIAYKTKLLSRFRKKIKKAEVPTWMEYEFNKIIENYPEDTYLRFRSSTNNEDLEDFSGAGLYDSYSHKDFTKSVSDTVKKVWASIWNYRAYEERSFYKIIHGKTMMGVCVHPRYKGEKANGVAVTKNIFNERKKGFYINVQAGESLVTNPGELTIPEEIVVIESVNKKDYVLQYVRYSNLVAKNEKVLSQDNINALLDALEKIDEHFKKVYKIQKNTKFAMEIEFKITVDGILHIKQARPWVEA